jgi:hypothetical protein
VVENQNLLLLTKLIVRTSATSFSSPTRQLVIPLKFSDFQGYFMSSNTAKLSSLSMQEITDLEIKAFEGAKKCRMSLVQIGRRFLSHVLGIHVCQHGFDQVRSEYIRQTGKDDVAENENEFYKYISKYYLWLDKEPKEEFLKSFYQAKDDLDNIDNQIHLINEMLTKLENRKKADGWLNGKDRYERNLYEYYKDKNIAAKDEILRFISEDIEHHALMKSSTISSMNSVGMLISGEMPYSYSRGLFFSKDFDRYDVRNVTELSNKFLDFSVPRVLEIRNLYLENKNNFYFLAEEYISVGIGDTKSAIDKIKSYIESSHIVANRRDIILTILKHYQNKDFISVVNMLPMQIEGLFHDVCLEVGIDESKLDISSVNEKLRIINSKFDHFIYFEYYSFKFPVIRNLVAHGKLMEDDVKHTAIMLMLDVLPVCELSLSEEIPTMKKIQLLEKSLKNDYKSLIEYFDYVNVRVPKFYGLENSEKVVEEKFNCENFWEYLEGELKKEKTEKVNNSKIMRFIKKLHGSKNLTSNSEKFLKSMPNLIKEMKAAELEREKQLEPFLQAIKRTNK